MTATLSIAFILGFWGSLHCIGMCGGIVGVLYNSLSSPVRQDGWSRKKCWLAYNSGRIFSYSIAGGLAAWIGSTLLEFVNPDHARRIGLFISGLFMIAFGLYLAGWWQGLSALERTGARLWKHIRPLANAFLPVQHVHQAIIIGMVWGWLPCGLVYSALAFAFTLPGLAQGMIHMAAFGLGTLPMLLLMGSTAGQLSRIARQSSVRKVAGSAIILFGIATFIGISPVHMGHHENQEMHSHE